MFRPLTWPDESLPTTPYVEVVPMPNPLQEAGRANGIMAIRITMDAGITNRFLVCAADFALAKGFLTAACSSGDPRMYRLDILGSDDGPYIPVDATSVALHIVEFRSVLSAANRCGFASAHWMPHSEVGDHQGRWRFMHPNSSTLRNDIDDWIARRLPA